MSPVLVLHFNYIVNFFEITLLKRLVLLLVIILLMFGILPSIAIYFCMDHINNHNFQLFFIFFYEHELLATALVLSFFGTIVVLLKGRKFIAKMVFVVESSFIFD